MPVDGTVLLCVVEREQWVGGSGEVMEGRGGEGRTASKAVREMCMQFWLASLTVGCLSVVLSICVSAFSFNRVVGCGVVWCVLLHTYTCVHVNVMITVMWGWGAVHDEEGRGAVLSTDWMASLFWSGVE
uniref:Transmembrane protein n=1 Tax=Vitrella brassicaformis TaxID=1169539 RepID=A0A7S1JSR5_9ALVE